jgi:DNA primase
MSRKNKLVDFRAVRAAVSMEDVLGRYGLLDKMKRTGDSLSGCCPVHKGSNPTQFRVSLSKNVWNCFSECKAGGNVIDFIARMEGVTVYTAAQAAINWFKLPDENVYTERDGSTASSHSVSEQPAGGDSPRLPRDPIQPAAIAAPKSIGEGTGSNPPLKFRLDKLDREHPYLTERGLNPETIADFEIGFCSKGMMADRIAIPIRNAEGAIVAYAGRWAGDPPEGTPKYRLPTGFRKSQELFNLDRARLEPVEVPLVVVEGFFDAMKLHQLGHRRVVALMGSSLSLAQEELIRRHFGVKTRIVIMLDEDDAGRVSRDEIAARLAKSVFVRIHVFDREGQQPEQLIRGEAELLFA